MGYDFPVLCVPWSTSNGSPTMHWYCSKSGAGFILTARLAGKGIADRWCKALISGADDLDSAVRLLSSKLEASDA